MCFITAKIVPREKTDLKTQDVFLPKIITVVGFVNAPNEIVITVR